MEKSKIIQIEGRKSKKRNRNEHIENPADLKESSEKEEITDNIVVKNTTNEHTDNNESK